MTSTPCSLKDSKISSLGAWFRFILTVRGLSLRKLSAIT